MRHQTLIKIFRPLVSNSQTGIREAEIGNTALKKTLTCPTISSTYVSNLALTTELLRFSRSLICKFVSRNFFKEPKVKTSWKNLHFNCIESSRICSEALFFPTAVLPIPRSRLPELRYRPEIQNGRSHWHYLDVCKVWCLSDR